MDNITRPTVMEISLRNLNYNIKKIQEYVGKDIRIMPVVKANGYGTYANKNLDFLNSFDIVAVAIVDEGIEIRNLGYKGEIFVLNQPYKDEIEKIIKYKITVGISSIDLIKELGDKTDKIKIHLEIDTGMGRTGINPSKIEDYICEIQKYSNIELEGVYTHFSSADSDYNYTRKQIESFRKVINKIKELNINLKYVHCSASNGIINFKDSFFNMVRPGIILYGFEPFDGALDKIDIRPVCKLKSKITFLKEVSSGTSIGYSRGFITTQKTKVATVPIGYADGLRRFFSNRGEVVINNTKVPIIGSVCMDSIMIDVTNIKNVKIGDDVYIWDNNLIRVEDIAKELGTINYEVISTISDRVPRVFIN